MKFKVVLLMGLLSVCLNSVAHDLHSDSKVKISSLKFYANDEPMNPSWAGLIQVKFEQPVIWSQENICRNDQVAIKNEDSHLVAAVQTAYALDKSISVQSDTTLLIDTVCILRTLQY